MVSIKKAKQDALKRLYSKDTKKENTMRDMKNLINGKTKENRKDFSKYSLENVLDSVFNNLKKEEADRKKRYSDFNDELFLREAQQEGVNRLYNASMNKPKLPEERAKDMLGTHEREIINNYLNKIGISNRSLESYYRAKERIQEDMKAELQDIKEKIMKNEFDFAKSVPEKVDMYDRGKEFIESKYNRNLRLLNIAFGVE
jgi:hypothetical protein